MFGNQNIHFWEDLFSKFFFTSCSCFWIFGILECIFCCFCCLVLKTLKVFLESEYMQFGGGGGERCKTFVTINWFSGLAARAL